MKSKQMKPLSHRLAQISVTLAQLGAYLGLATFLLAIVAHFSQLVILKTVTLTLVLCFMVSLVILFLGTVLALVTALFTGSLGSTVAILLEEKPE